MIWILNNCLLLITGTIACVMGVSFYIRNKESTGNIRYYMPFYGIFSALWCFSYAVLGMTPDLTLCPYIRIPGLIAINAFLINEVFVVTEGRCHFYSYIFLCGIRYRPTDLFENKCGYIRA